MDAPPNIRFILARAGCRFMAFMQQSKDSFIPFQPESDTEWHQPNT